MAKARLVSRLHSNHAPAALPPPLPAVSGGTRFPFWGGALILLVVLALAALIGEIVLLAVMGRRTEPAANKPEAAAPVPKAPDEVKPKVPEPSKADAKEASTTTPLAIPVPSDEASPLEAVGLLTGVHLYQTHLSIGLLADAAENDVYSSEEAGKLLDGITGMMDTVEKELAALPDASLKPADRAALQKAKDLTGLLRTETAELRAYWDNGEKDHVDKFHKARERAWEGVKGLLHIEE